MQWSLLTAAFPFLLVIAYLMVTAIMRILTLAMSWELELHHKIVASKRMRAEYLADLSIRQGGNVDVVDP